MGAVHQDQSPGSSKGHTVGLEGKQKNLVKLGGKIECYSIANILAIFNHFDCFFSYSFQCRFNLACLFFCFSAAPWVFPYGHQPFSSLPFLSLQTVHVS